MRRSLWGMGRVLVREGAARQAAVLFAAVEAAIDEAPPWIDEVREPADYQQCVALIESALSPADIDDARRRGARMTLHQATAYTLGLLDKTAPA